MGIILDFTSFTESEKFQDLSKFTDEMFLEFFTADDVFYDEELDKKEKLTNFIAKNSKGIILDVTGGFGFRKETLIVNSVVLAKETELDINKVKKKVMDVFKRHQNKINKRVNHTLYLFTYK